VSFSFFTWCIQTHKYYPRALLRDNKHAVEKEQVIKLIRIIVEVGTVRRDPEMKSGPGSVPISETVMRSIIAVAEHPEDPFRLICIQTLAEICPFYAIPFAFTEGPFQ
jgi:large subunit ribosomal protein L17e